MQIAIYHCGLSVLVNLWTVHAFSRVSTTLSKSRTQLHAVDSISIVEAYQKKTAALDITADIDVPTPVTPTPNINIPDFKDLNELTSYLDESVNSVKDAAAQAASAASEIMKQPLPAMDDGKAYSLFEYLKTLNGQENAGVGVTVNQERIDSLMNNFMGYKNTVITETDKAASSPHGAALAANLQQYFPWYVAAFAVLYSVNTKNDAKAEMKRQYQEELVLYKAKAEEAASAALQAAEGAKSIKDAVLASGTASVNIVSSTVTKLEELQEDKEITKKEIAKLITDLQSLQDKFDTVLAQKEELETKISATVCAPKILGTTAPLVDEALFTDETKEKVTPKKALVEEALFSEGKKEKVALKKAKPLEKSKAGIEDEKILEVLKAMDEKKSLKDGKGIMETEVKAKTTTNKAKSSKSAKSNKVTKAATKEKEVEKTNIDVSIPYDAAAKLAYDEWRGKYGKGNFDEKKYERFQQNYKLVAVANVKAAKDRLDGKDAPPNIEMDKFADTKVLEPKKTVAEKEKTTPIDVSIPYNAAAKLAYDEWRGKYGKGNFDEKKYERFQQNYKLVAVANVKAAKDRLDGKDAPPNIEMDKFADTKVLVAKKEPKKAAAGKEKTTPKKTIKRRKSTKVEESIIVESDEPIIVVKEEKTTPKKVKSKKEEEPFFAAVVEEKIEESTEKIVKHPWSKLSPSTLNRKTVKELSSFLEERGAAYADNKGKPLLKKVLVSTVQEYLY